MFKGKNLVDYRKVKNAGGLGSKLEHSVHQLLLLRERSGEISDLRCQCPVVLQDGPREVKITWKVDFAFMKDGVQWYAEAKGFKTDVYLLKLKIFKFRKIGPLEIWTGSAARPVLSETFFPGDAA